VTITLKFDAEVPKGPDDYPAVEGAMTVRLETTRDAINASVLSVRQPKK
jgi:hypothetical protein